MGGGSRKRGNHATVLHYFVIKKGLKGRSQEK